VVVPSVLVLIFLDNKAPWAIYHKVVSWLKDKDDSIRVLIDPILLWLLKCVTKGPNEDTSKAALALKPVVQPSQKLKAWQVNQLDQFLGKWRDSPTPHF
jgi:hypothetical protein